MDVLIERFQKFSEQLIFCNTNGRVLAKIQAAFFLEQPGPNKGCFSRPWALLGARKSVPKKLKNNFFSKISSIL